MSHDNDIKITRAIALELTPAHATLLEIHSNDALATAVLKTGSVTFGELLPRLCDHDAADRLVEELRPLIQECSLHGRSVSMLLSGEFCSTRVLRGDAEAIRRGMLDLEKLKHHYMGLGRGEKALSSVVRGVDAREERATVAVAVESTLELLIEAAERLGIELETVEPSVIGLSRLCGYLGVDAAQPVAVVSADATGSDIALSYQGDLLLHHRLHAPLETEGEQERVRQQLCLLAQYAGRFSPAARENNLPVYVVTKGSSEDGLVEILNQHPDLDPHTFDAAQLPPAWKWELSDELRAPWTTIGGCLRPFMGERAAPAPDMVHNLTGTSNLKVIQARRKMVFPLVAAGVVGLAVGLAALWESTAAASLAANLKRFESVEQQLAETKLQLNETRQLNQSTETIGKLVSGIDWQRELRLLAQCRPDGVWLKRISLMQDGTLTIAGTSTDDATIYKFEKWLNEAPAFGRVTLTSTRAGAQTEFEMECNIRGRGGY